MAIDKTVNVKVDTGDSKKKVDGVNKSLGKTGGAAETATKKTKGLAGGFKGMGVAMKAMGIGLIIAAFVKLKDLFTGNIETARRFERIGAKLSAMFDVVRDAAEPLFIALMDGFSNPKKAIEDLWTALKENIVNRIQGLIDGFGALGKVIKGVFKRDLDLIKEGTAEAKDGFLTLATGMDEVARGEAAENLKKKFKEITEEMKKEGDEAARLTGIMQDVRDEERAMLMIRAKANKQIAESRLLAEDDTKSNEERLKALKDAVAEEQRVAQIELDIQEKKVNAMQAMIDLGKSSEEDIQKLAEERARFIELQTGSTLRQKRVAAEVGVFTAKVEKEKTDAIKEQIALEEQLAIAKEKGFKVTQDLDSKAVKALIKTNEAKLKEEEKLQDAREKAISGAMKSIANLVGKDTKAGKALAIGQAIRDTYVGANKALAQGGILGFAGAAGIIATGLSNVKTILSTDAGDGEGGDSSVSEATTSTAPAQLGGVGGDLIPNMNSIIPGGANGIQPVQAYVVETDISDSQALQEELDIQATL